jgi:hypothetical protein
LLHVRRRDHYYGAIQHDFRVGDIVTVLFTDNSQYWGDAIVASVTNGGTSFTANKNCNSANAVARPGVVALAYDAILDGAQGTHWENIQYDFASEDGAFNNFFDFWDDENATIEHFNNNGISLNANLNWTGSFIFSGGNPLIPGQQWAPVITVRDSSIAANYSNCVTDYNSNGLYIENTVRQASGLWEVHSSNTTGNYQGAYLKNIYSESRLCENPPAGPSCPTGAKNPFPGLKSRVGRNCYCGDSSNRVPAPPLVVVP